MSTQETGPTDATATADSDRADGRSSPGASAARIADRTGTAPVVAGAGGLLLAVAAWTARRNRRRAGLLALVGAVLLGVGLRRWQRTEEPSDLGREGPDRDVNDAATADSARGDDQDQVSEEAAAHRERADVLQQAETNPRGVSGEPDVEVQTEPDEGDVRFTAEQDEGVEPKPHLERADEEDPRRPDGDDPVTDDDHVNVNLSDAAMADEASEATGPTPEQAYPAREGTDPEPTSEEAPEWEGGESAAGTENPAAGEDDENRQTSDG